MTEYPQEDSSTKKVPPQSGMRGGFFASVIVGILVAWGGVTLWSKNVLAFDPNASTSSSTTNENTIRARFSGVDPSIIEAIVQLEKDSKSSWSRLRLIEPEKWTIHPSGLPIGLRTNAGVEKLDEGNYRSATERLFGASSPWVKKLGEWQKSGPKWPDMVHDWIDRFNDTLRSIPPPNQTLDVIRTLLVKTSLMTQYKFASPEWKKKFAVDAANASAWVARQSIPSQAPIARIQFSQVGKEPQTLSISPLQAFEDVNYIEGNDAIRIALTQWGADFSRSIPAVVPPATGRPSGGPSPAATQTSNTIVSSVPNSQVATTAGREPSLTWVGWLEPIWSKAGPTPLTSSAPAIKSPTASSLPSAPLIAIDPRKLDTIDAHIAENTAAQEEIVLAAQDAREKQEEHLATAQEQKNLAAAAKKRAEEEQQRIAALQKEVSDREKAFEEARKEEQKATEAMKQEQKAAQDAATLAAQQEAQKKALADKIVSDKAYKATIPVYQSSWLIPFNTTALALRQKLASKEIDVPSVNRDINELRKLRSAHDTLVQNWNPVAKAMSERVRATYSQLQQEIGMHRPSNHTLWILQ